MEAEAAVLGAMMLDADAIAEATEVLSDAEAFYQQSHAAIFKALVDLYRDSESIDMVHIHQRLSDQGLIEQIGGADYLVSLAESVPSPAGAKHYARIVRDKWLLRNLIKTTGDVLMRAYTSSEAVQDQLDIAEQAIYKLSDQEAGSEASDIYTLMQQLYTKLEANDGKAMTGLTTGFIDLDELTNGMHDGEMIVIAGRPSMGKTAFALNVAEAIAIGHGEPVAIFSLEMGKEQLAQRLLCSRSRVDSQKLRQNKLRPEDYTALTQTISELHESPLFIDDTPGLSLLGLKAKARRLAARRGLRAIFIDYLQLMSAPGHESRQTEVSAISRGVKELARDLEVPVVCLSQLNRSAENREDHRPRMSDLRESGSIEQDADVIMMLHREEYYHRDPEWADSHQDLLGVAEVIVAKQRNGPTDTVKLQFDSNTTRFNDLARQHTPAGYE